MKRMTIIVPDAYREAGAHVHFLMGKARNLHTYSATNWQDENDNLYAVSSGLWSDLQIAGVKNPLILQNPDLQDLFTENGGSVSRALCQQAQAVFEVYDAENPLQVDPSRILAIILDDALQALSLAGVTHVPSEDI